MTVRPPISSSTNGEAMRRSMLETMLTLEPLDDFVVVEPTDEEAETRLGLIIPASAEAHCRSGIVLAAGPDADGVAPGDKVLFGKDAGYDVRLAGTNQKVC